jgi:hypothetical protein
MGFSGLARILAFLLLIAATLFAAYLTSNLRIGDEHPALSAAARDIPLAGVAGDIIVCRFSAYWGFPCADTSDLPQVAQIPELAQIDFSVRYLCPVYRETAHIECADKYLIGACAGVIGLAIIVIIPLLVRRCWRSRDRADLVAVVLLHAVAEVIAVSLLCLLMLVRLPAMWMGGLSSAMIGRSNVLGFTGDMIGYCVLIALIAIALAGVTASSLRLAFFGSRP